MGRGCTDPRLHSPCISCADRPTCLSLGPEVLTLPIPSGEAWGSRHGAVQTDVRPLALQVGREWRVLLRMAGLSVLNLPRAETDRTTETQVL